MAVVSLALGIGANTAIFSVAHAYLLRVWQVRNPERLVFVAYTQAPPDMLGQMWLKIRTSGEPTVLIPTIRREIQEVAPRLVSAWTDTETDLIASTSGAEASLAELVSASGTGPVSRVGGPLRDDDPGGDAADS